VDRAGAKEASRSDFGYSVRSEARKAWSKDLERCEVCLVNFRRAGEALKVLAASFIHCGWEHTNGMTRNRIMSTWELNLLFSIK
jgi:hypothetical protein